MGHVRVPHEIPEFVLDFSHTISPKSFSGCNTPASQSIRWDSTSAKTITFTYSISSVTNYAISGNFSSSSPHISYSTTMAYRNRTANSVEVQATTTVTMQSGWSGYNYGIALKTTYGSVSTRACKLCPSFMLFLICATYCTLSTTGTAGGFLATKNRLGGEISAEPWVNSQPASHTVKLQNLQKIRPSLTR